MCRQPMITDGYFDIVYFCFYNIGESQDQLRINFTEIKKLSCRAENSIGQTETSININILCKTKQKQFFLKCLCYREVLVFFDK